METVYPAGPTSVPENLTKASAKYRRHAWLAVLGLFMFVLVYFALAAWFSWSAYQIITETVNGRRDVLFGWLVGCCSAFLGLFMIKALFFVKHSFEMNDMEVTAQEQPKLFEFLYKLADEAKAPRPYRVYLSPSVNACVFYELSILNLFLPTKKNLLIGLPLVNVLTLGELKAVLAHEFGHFAQKSMAVGRWVYIAKQIVEQIVGKRDFLDSLLDWISNFDLRVAWIGWIMKLIVWSIRSIMDSIFKIVLLADRALSREMEFQADLVSVSLTGSDALVHALHKLQSADDAWSRTLEFANSEVANGRAITDLFTVQDKISEKLRYILDDPEYGRVAPVPENDADKHRVFKDAIAHPPKMWETHPDNFAREENAKRIYVATPIDEHPAWDVFNDPDALRKKVTADMLAEAECQECNLEDTFKNLDEQYRYRFLNPSYKGSYLGRSLTLHADQVTELYDDSSAESAEKLLGSLYPKSLTAALKELRDLEEELATLQALKDGFLKAAGGVIRHNGYEYKRKQLKGLIEEQKQRVAEKEAIVHGHDKKCRTAHLQAAKVLGEDWAEYLKGLMGVLHYSEHTLAEIHDVYGLLKNVTSVILADGKVSSGELKRLLKTGCEVCDVLRSIFKQTIYLRLDSSLLKRLEIESWQEGLGEFSLPYPSNENISEWMQAIDGWFGMMINAFSTLRRETLEQLLTTESYIGHKYKDKTAIPMEYGVSRIPDKYKRLLPGSERELQKRLDLWDRFQTADGFVGAFSRFTVAASIVGTVLWYSINEVLSRGYFY